MGKLLRFLGFFPENTENTAGKTDYENDLSTTNRKADNPSLNSQSEEPENISNSNTEV